MKNQFGKLPKAFKRKWLSALRSGKFKQGKSYLKQQAYNDVPAYCCLGVAGEMMNCKRMDEQGYLEIGNGIIGLKKIPKIFFKKDEHDEFILQRKLSDLNDEKKWGFKRIANWIEKNL